jgi:Ca2+-binding RTX toxin-like protein
VIEGSSDGFDTEQSSISRTIDANVERLVLIGAATTATGDNRANVLTGNDGNNVLDGGHGGDSMAGGKGDDTYKVDFGLDQVSEAAGPGTGTDVVDSDVPQVLAANVENLNLGQSAGNIEGIGNAAANTIVGNDSANLLDGGAGDDTLKGQGGDDTLLGGAGNDILNSGLGRDVLSGGAGADHFVFNFAVASGTNVDQIVDFVKGQDVIDLSTAIFSAAGAPGTALAASDFVTGPAAVAHDASDHIIHDTSTGMLYYDADGSGAQQMVAFAQVNLGQALGASDFHLIA